MGHKVHPTGFRLGIVKDWQSTWYAERDYKDLFAEDVLIRTSINKDLSNASVSRIEIERAASTQVSVTIYTAKPGIVIGKSGEKVDRLRAMLEAKIGKRVRLNIKEIRQPELDALLVGRSIAEQLEKRVSFRRAIKQAVQKSMRANAKGVKVIVGGRLGGAEIARTEKEVEGKVPLHTLRADIDYGQTEAHTTFGVIGIKVWIYKGDILPGKRRVGAEAQDASTQPSYAPRDGGDRRGGGDRNQRGGGGGDRDRRGGGERGGDRGPRPRGDQPRGVSGGGDRRPMGDRGPRPRGDQPQGQPGQPQGGPPRAPRPPRPPRAPRSEQPPTQSAPAPSAEPVQPVTPPPTPASNESIGGSESE